jgi:SAM-dependent methyltransferase
MIYPSINEPILDRVPTSARRILDVGCGTGALGGRLKQTRPCEVTGLTYSQAEVDLATKVIDRPLLMDLNHFDPAPLGRFDCIICSHVLEHLHRPDILLTQLAPLLEADGRLLVALPNILHWRQRLVFLRGRWKYEDYGLLDRTHYRFFDWEAAQALVNDHGFEICEAAATGTFPGSRFLGRAGRWLDRRGAALWPGLLGFQFVLSARRRAGGVAGA